MLNRYTEILRWVAVAFILPTVVFHVGYVLLVNSPITTLDRLLFREDACPYFICFIVGFLVFGFASIARKLRSTDIPDG